MDCKWTVAPLGELISYIGKGIIPRYIDNEDEPGAMRVLGQRCVRAQKVDFLQARLHDSLAKPVADKKVVQTGDILINATGVGSAGRVAQVITAPAATCTTDGHVITLRAGDIDPIYLGYFVKLKQALIEQLAEGSTGQTEMNRNRLQNEIRVTYPVQREHQRRIASFFLAIDRMITLNQQTNDYLAAQEG
ncbi:restriction endonuclease subunit S [Collinsella ihumii]|uniref:Restriction endonuclease subunit S n=1 Tax=Collinsella ihumii TaxID=1720204 RepID=A0AAW7JSH2_9ACTN|nr:restriction endonuclease subunit S [Collinsella ihumii]MDN0069714.1 restriction endonuclease subunit S [Collinsella ihumii]